MTKPNKKKEERRGRFLWITIGIVVVIVALFFINKATEPDSTIEINPVGQSADVYLNRTQAHGLNPNSPTSYPVSAGNHQVLIAQDDFWPWTENVTTQSNNTSTLSPFLIEQSGKRVVQAPESITNAFAEKRNKPTPSDTNPVISPSGDIRVYVNEGTNIIAQWTAGTSSAPDYFNCEAGACGVSVYNNQQVRDIEFYPNRSDVIFFATENEVYAIEIDPSDNTQNFQPVVEGVVDPVFVLTDDQIYVSAGGRITVSDI